MHWSNRTEEEICVVRQSILWDSITSANTEPKKPRNKGRTSILGSSPQPPRSVFFPSIRKCSGGFGHRQPALDANCKGRYSLHSAAAKGEQINMKLLQQLEPPAHGWCKWRNESGFPNGHTHLSLGHLWFKFQQCFKISSVKFEKLPATGT